ncbi:MAG: DNA mismatch repair protein MutS [Candidatus Marinimicrobia bacterium]|nr:DNA mismatch repair protein MutS [Candidatus Neomarinimicrobiota bacterium]
MAESTPMMQQYRRIRSELPAETILFFRMGDFYEMFFEDAVAAAPILEIALTRRNGVPMCGVPYHACEAYLAKLVRAGRKVALCDQMEDPSQTKGIVRREVTRVVSPGAIIEEHLLEAGRGNYLAGVAYDQGRYGLALLELSTGAFTLEEAPTSESVTQSLARAAPAECVVPEKLFAAPEWGRVLPPGFPGLVTRAEDWTFDLDYALETLTRQFGTRSLEGFGCGGLSSGVRAAGGILHYVSRDLRRPMAHIRGLRVRTAGECLVLDPATVANLDLVQPRGAAPPNVPTTLLKCLDSTCTPLGRRLLRAWILEPLARLEPLQARQAAVADLAADWNALNKLRATLGEVRDLERLLGRLHAGGGNARDVRALAQSLAALPVLRAHLAAWPGAGLARWADALEPQPELVALIERALVDEPPATLKDGGLFRPGYHAELDELRAAAGGGRTWLAEYQTREQERTGIKSLKVRHNKVFGYYLEVTQANLGLVPPEYQRKQTLVNAERFITPELKTVEDKILGAQERALALETELFQALRTAVTACTDPIQRSASALAELDVLAAFAERARTLNYTRPTLTDGTRLEIKGGRHPIVEQMPAAERFVPNDAVLDGAEHHLIVLTGPNMAGKSTYIRQVALIVIMAQIGSFVPADEAEIGLVDRVFTRVGAGDDLAQGRSTFMVEMEETANILNSATPHSLIVLDEIGRGTSTFDGISIAWAVAEHLHKTPQVRAKTLFATHYHELTDLARTLPGVRNYNVLVREQGDQIAFLRKIVPGAADKSYGIQVARLAGLPPEVIERAREILANLEEEELGEGGQPRLARHRLRRLRPAAAQLDLFRVEAC